MAFDNTKMANRLGLDLKFYAYTNGTAGSAAVATIDFANEVSLDLSSDMVWATGGQEHANLIGFNNPVEGTLTISTQIVTMTVLALAAGADLTTDTSVTFKNDTSSVKPKYYTIVGETVWVDESGVSHNETITVHKACVKPGYNSTYTGDGDPQSIDIEFELGTDENGKVVTFGRTKATS